MNDEALLASIEAQAIRIHELEHEVARLQTRCFLLFCHIEQIEQQRAEKAAAIQPSE